MSAAPKAFGLVSLVALVVANMVGAGVFTTSGFALADLHTPNRVLLAWLVGGGLAMCGAIAYGALVEELAESGGEYLFLGRLVHPMAGFLAGWVSLLAGFTAAIAFAAVTFEVYALPEIARPNCLPEGVLATSVIIISALLHGYYKRAGIVGQNALVILKLLLLGFFLVFAFSQLGVGKQWPGAQVDVAPPFAWSSFARSLMWISLSYAGFNAAVYVASEAKAARKTVPKALWLGTGLVAILYLALNVVFVYAPPTIVLEGRVQSSATGQADVAAIAARAIGGETMVAVVRGLIALALLTSVLSMILAGPRVYARMADDGLFPKRMRFREGAPKIAILVQAILAIILVWISELRELLSYLGFTLSLSSAAAVACLFRVHAQPDKKVRLAPRIAACVYVVMTVIIAGLGASQDWRPGIAGLATIVSGLVAYRYFVWVEKKRRLTKLTESACYQTRN